MASMVSPFCSRKDTSLDPSFHLDFSYLNLPSANMSGLMSATVIWDKLSPYFSLACSNKPKAMSPVPPATSRNSKGREEPGLIPASNSLMKWCFQSSWTPNDMASFMTSYLEATEENTPSTIFSLSSVLTVLKPKWVVSSSGVGLGAAGLALDNSDGVGVTRTSSPTLDGDNGVALLQKTQVNGLSDSPSQSALNILLPVLDSLLLGDEWVDTSVQVGETSGSAVSGDHHDWHVRLVLGDQSTGLTRGGQHDNGLGVLLVGGGDGGNGTGLGGVGWSVDQGSELVEQRSVGDGLLSNDGGVVHHGHGLEWVVTLGGLTRQHDTVSTVQDGVTDVGNLGSGWSRVVGHGLQHSGGTDDGLGSQVTLGNQSLLHNEHSRSWDLDTQVTSGDHDTVGLLQDVVEVVDTSSVLDLGDDLNVLAVLTQDLSDLLDVVAGSDERGEDHVDTVLDTESDVGLVLLGQSWQVDVGAWQVDTLVGADLTSVDGLDLQGLVVNNIEHLERQHTVVDVDDSALLDDLGDVLVVDVHDLVVTLLGVGVVGGEGHLVVGRNWVVLLVDGGTGSDLWTLGVQCNGQRTALVKLLGLSGVVNDGSVVLVRTVGEVHTDNVQTGLSQLDHHLGVVGLRTNGADDGRTTQVLVGGLGGVQSGQPVQRGLGHFWGVYGMSWKKLAQIFALYI